MVALVEVVVLGCERARAVEFPALVVEDTTVRATELGTVRVRVGLVRVPGA